MDVTLYTNSSDKRYLNKSLTSYGSYSGLTIKDSMDILTPTFIIGNFGSVAADIMGFVNYCYIPNLSRYYYITDKKLLTGTRIQFTCLVDPLYTYRNAILNCNGTAVRNENQSFSYIVDDQVPVESYLTVKYLAISDLFDNKTVGTNFILNVAGGGGKKSGGETK